MRKILFFFSLALLSVAPPAPGTVLPGAAEPTAMVSSDSVVVVPSFHAAPTFFETFYANYSDDINLSLLHEGEVQLSPLGIENIEHFDWKIHARTDQSWWYRMENLTYLLPLMASGIERDQDFVRHWITGWLDAHEADSFPNKGCRDAMTVGQRGMVLTWYIKQLESEYGPDNALLNRLKTSVLWHQTYLEEHYNAVSNHAMWESMGLFETTRVHPNPRFSFIALERLIEIVELSTSEMGFHTEHSTAYHFYFLRWLSDFTAYLLSLPDLDWPDVSVLAERERRMHKMTYYLCDRRGRLSQIGDTDSITVDDVYWRRPPRSRTTSVYDENAGYAIFKDPPRAKNRRYVVFRILKNMPILRFHVHDDCLSVYYSWDGEVILSDQGRYSYTQSPTRHYFTSVSAHNTVVASKFLPVRGYRFYASETWREEDTKRCLFGASLGDESVTRAVEIPIREPELRVFDTIIGNEPFSLLWNIGSDVVSVDEYQEDVHVTDPSEPWRRFTWELTTAKKRKFLISIEVLCGENVDDVMAHIITGWEQPMLGWYSSGYNSCVPASVIRIDVNVQQFANVRTRITRVR